MNNRLGLLGAGSQAREIISYLTQDTEVFFAVTSDYLDPENHRLVDINNPTDNDRMSPVICAVGPPGLRRRLVEEWPGTAFATVISESAYVGSSCQIGLGTVISPGSVLTVNVNVGAHCQINVGATLSHDVEIGSFVTIGPGAHLAGNVRLGDGVFVGAGANVINEITIAPGVVIGAGSTVLADISVPKAVVVGSPAKITSVREDWLSEI